MPLKAIQPARINILSSLGPSFSWTKLPPARDRCSATTSARMAAALPRLEFAKDVEFRLFTAATWLPVLIWLKEQVGEVTIVEGSSMAPTLNGDFNSTLRRDKVLTYKWGIREKVRDLKRGTIITFRYRPAQSLLVSLLARY